jgi:predicted transcriptional regulator
MQWEDIIEDLSPKTSLFKVLVYLAFKGPCQPNEVSVETGIPAGSVRPSLRTLLEKGYVEQLSDGDYKSIIPFTEIVSHLYLINKN